MSFCDFLGACCQFFCIFETQISIKWFPSFIEDCNFTRNHDCVCLHWCESAWWSTQQWSTVSTVCKEQFYICWRYFIVQKELQRHGCSKHFLSGMSLNAWFIKDMHKEAASGTYSIHCLSGMFPNGQVIKEIGSKKWCTCMTSSFRWPPINLIVLVSPSSLLAVMLVLLLQDCTHLKPQDGRMRLKAIEYAGTLSQSSSPNSLVVKNLIHLESADLHCHGFDNKKRIVIGDPKGVTLSPIILSSGLKNPPHLQSQTVYFEATMLGPIFPGEWL